MPGVPCPVPSPLALVLTKLEAGGGKDQSDILELVRVQRLLNGAPWLAHVSTHLPELSAEARELWGRITVQLA
jgi:hypothetical protein